MHWHCPYCKILTYLLVLISVSTGFSQSGNYSGTVSGFQYFKRFTVDEGLSQNLISSIYQDHLGYLWVGTKDGLNMFDGYNFRVNKYDPSDEYSLTDNHITAIYEDVYKRLWIGTFNEGLHYFDRLSRRFVRFSNDPENDNSISGNHIQAIVGDKDGNLWVGTGTSIFRHDTALNDVSFVTIEYDIDDAVSAGIIPQSLRQGSRVIFEDGNGEIWMGNRFGLFIFDTRRRLFARYNPQENPLPLKRLLRGQTGTLETII